MLDKQKKQCYNKDVNKTNKQKKKEVFIMATTKITNLGAINYVLETFGADIPEEYRTKIESIKASFEKKSENRKPTKVQEANEELKTVVIEVLTGEENALTVSEILKKSDKFADVSNQKMSALLKQLVDCGKVVKTVDKKKALFKVA